MAGVGFELKKLFKKKDSYVDTVKAYSVSAIVTEGPMVLSILMILILKWLIKKNGGVQSQQEVFFVTITYVMIFSMIIANILIMFITRYISDCIYEEKEEKIISAFYGSSCLLLIVGGIICAIFLFNLEASIVYKLISYIQFLIVMIIWVALSFLSAIKQYSKILKGFFICLCISVMITILLIFIKIDLVIAALSGSTIGYFYMFVVFIKEINEYYPKGKLELFKFIGALDDYKILVAIGFLLTLGLYAHNFVMWGSEYSTVVFNKIKYCMIYDVPAFFACMTIIPMFVQFVVSLETNFYSKYLKYFKAILYGGRMQDIDNARENMINVLFREIVRMLEVQFIFSIVCIVFVAKILQLVGFDDNMIGIFRILCFGYSLFGLERCITIVLLYFDDRIGACISAGIFAIGSIIFSWITVLIGIDYYGLGFLLAGFVSAIYSIFRLRYYIVNLDYNIFCKQPLFFIESNGIFGKIENFIDKKIDK